MSEKTIKQNMMISRIKHFANKRVFRIPTLCDTFSTNEKGVMEAIKELRKQKYFVAIAGEFISISRL